MLSVSLLLLHSGGMLVTVLVVVIVDITTIVGIFSVMLVCRSCRIYAVEV